MTFHVRRFFVGFGLMLALLALACSGFAVVRGSGSYEYEAATGEKDTTSNEGVSRVTICPVVICETLEDDFDLLDDEDDFDSTGTAPDTLL